MDTTDNRPVSADSNGSARQSWGGGRRRLAALGAVLALASAPLAACGSDDDSKGSGSGGGGTTAGSSEFGVKEDKTLHDKLPKSYQDSGVKAAVFNDWAPDEFLNKDGELDGWSVDLAKAMSAKLGVKFTLTGSSFDAILPAIQNKRFDAGFASFAPIADRLPVLDFIPEKQDGTGYASLTKSNLDIAEEKDLCGHSVAVLTGAYDFQALTKTSKETCEANDLGAIEIQQFPQEAAAELAMSSGRVELVAAGVTKLGYLAKQKGDITVADYVLRKLPDNYISIGVRKGDELGPVFKDTLQSLIDDGTYQKIMDKWGLGDNKEVLLSKAMLITQDNPNGED